MIIIKRSGAEIDFDILKIEEAISKAAIAEMERDIDLRIRKLMEFVGYINDFDSLEGSYQILLERKRRIRYLRKLKNERIRFLLWSIWLRRNSGVGRSETSAVSDLMLLTLPTPPTAKTANCSLWQRGMTCGATA